MTTKSKTKKSKSEKSTRLREEMETHAVLPYSIYKNGQWFVYNIADDKEAQEQVKQRLRKQMAGLERSIQRIEEIGGR